MPELLIGTYFKRPNAPVELSNDDGSIATYFFRPVDPANPDSEHVALVSDRKHQQRLLQITEGYYISEAQLAVDVAKAAASKTQRPSVSAPQQPLPVPTPPASDETSPPPSTSAGTASPVAPEASDVDKAAAELLGLPLAAFKQAIADEKTAQAILQKALEVESARGSEERPTYTKHLRAAIKA